MQGFLDIFDIYLLEAVVNGILLGGVLALLALGLNLIFGVLDIVWIAYVDIPSFIVTLAGMLYFRGLSMIATNGATVAPLPRSLISLATGFLPPAPSIAAVAIALLAYAGFRLLEIRRGRVLGVVARPTAAMAGKYDGEMRSGIATFISSSCRPPAPPPPM